MALELEDRKCKLKTALGEGVLQLKRMQMTEAVSSLFEMNLELASTDARIKAKDLIGTSVTLEMPLHRGEVRYFNGIVSRFVHLGTYRSDDERLLVAYQATVVPWFWTLTRNSDCRVFEKKSVVEIAEQIFKDYGYGDYEFYKLATNAKSEIMDYCVQYRESDFAFLSRLFEKWGLAYTFVHEDEKHTLRIFDDSASLPDNEHSAEAKFYGEGGSGRRGDIDSWTDFQELLPGKWSIKDYNFEDPMNDLEMPTNSQIQIGENSRYEAYDYPGEFVNEEGTTGSRGEAFAKFRMEAEEADSRLIQGDGVCTGFTAGTHFKLKDHFNDDFNDQRYFITSVTHTIGQSVGTERDPTIYENVFSCLPSDIPYRDKLTTPKPVVHGNHTALVVGPSGEEIHCDKYGRVRIQFPWDRYGKKDGTNVCWARCQQSVGGKKWGMQFVPRIGQEVVVAFLEGDPDRPLVTGVVYNQANMPPYELPANKTQAGWKTRSTTGGAPDNFNEIRLEDKKGSEEFFMQAEKDMNVNVKNNRGKTIGNDQTLSVGNDETSDIGNNRTETVGNDESVTVGNNQTIAVASDRTRTVGKNESVTVTMARTHNVGINEAIQVGAAQEVTVGAMRSLAVGMNQETNIGRDHSVSVGKNQEIDVGAGHSLSVAEDSNQKIGKKLTIDAGDQITIKTGKAKITMKKNGDISIEGKLINVKGSGNIVMKAKKILEN